MGEGKRKREPLEGDLRENKIKKGGKKKINNAAMFQMSRAASKGNHPKQSQTVFISYTHTHTIIQVTKRRNSNRALRTTKSLRPPLSSLNICVCAVKCVAFVAQCLAVHSRSPTSNNPIIIIRLSLRFFFFSCRSRVCALVRS